MKEQQSAMMKGNILVCVIFLAAVTLADYLRDIGMIPISGAVPAMMFQLLLLADRTVREENDNKGILQIIWEKLRKPGNNGDNPA